MQGADGKQSSLGGQQDPQSQQGMQGQQQGMQGQQMAQVSCDQIVDQQTRQKHLKDAKVTDVSSSAGAQGGTQSGQQITLCRVDSPNMQQPVAIQAVCSEKGQQGAIAQSSTDLQKQHPGSQQVQNVGKAAVITKSGDTQILSAIDDDSNCQIDLAVPANVDAESLGRALLDNLPARG